MQYRQFQSINEARLHAGLLRCECLQLFGISERTWYRWCNHGAPGWAYRLLEFQAGHLDALGWIGWRISSDGRLHTSELSARYWWRPGDLLMRAFNLRLVVMPANLSVSANDRWPEQPTAADHRITNTSYNV